MKNNLHGFTSERKFKEEQEKNTQEIVKKILKENENIDKKRKKYPNLFNINLKPLDKRNVIFVRKT